MNTNSFIDKITNIFFPDSLSCINCNVNLLHNHELLICDDCFIKFCEEKQLSLFKYIDKSNGFQLQRVNSIDDADIICLFKYEGIARKLVTKLKFGFHKSISRILSNALSFEVGSFKPDIIIPVPLSKRSKKERGFNQSSLIARELSEIIDVGFADNDLVRTRDNKHQVGLNREQRMSNVKNTFLSKTKYNGENILLVDDVLTTGATAYHSRQALISAGAKVKVICICYADRVN